MFKVSYILNHINIWKFGIQKHIKQANKYEQEKKFKLAFDEWSLYIKKSKNPQLEHLIKAGKIAIKLKKLDKAHHLFDTAIHKFPSKIEGYEAKATTLNTQGKNEQALKLTEHILSRFPNEYSILLLNANLLHKASLFEHSIPAYNHLISKYRNKPNSYICLLQHYMKFKQFDNALELSNKLLDNCPNNINAYINKIKALRGLNQLQLAKNTCDTLIKKHTESHYGYLELAELYLQIGNANNALKNFERAYTFNPNLFRIIKLYTKTLFNLGETEKAITLLNHHIFELNEKRFLPLLFKMLAKVNLPEQLMKLITKQDKFFNNNLNSLYEIGVILKTNGHFNLSIQTFDRIVTQFEKSFNNNIIVFQAYTQLLLINNIVEHKNLFQNNELLSDVNINNKLLINNPTKKILNSLMSNREKLKPYQSDVLNREYYTTIKSYFHSIHKIKSQIPHSLMGIEYNPNEAISLCDNIIHRFYNKKPTSIIRLGDGEGNFLPYDKNSKEKQSHDQLEIQLRWWGEKKINDSESESLISRFQNVINNADILGIPPIQRMNKSLGVQSKNLNSHHRGLLSIFHSFQDNISINAEVLTSCHFHNDLQSWDMYRYLFNAIQKVSVISCHKNIPKTLFFKFGLETNQFIQIPPESFHKNKFGDENDNSNHYPDIFNNILSSIEVEKGEFFLVAAGFLGKFYCDLIKNKGGLAFDIGSVVDFWENHKTRISHKYSKLIKPIWLNYESLNYGKNNLTKDKPFFSNEYCDKNIYLSSTNKPKTTDVINKRILATGHPRCGSGFVAQALNQFKLNIGHEHLDNDGISSWLFAVKDFNLPTWNKNQEKDIHEYNNTHITFDHVIHFIRDPMEAIPSIMLENKNQKSFNFRRSHIYNNLSIDITNYNTMLEQAIASYIYWNEIIKKSFNVEVFRIEDGLDSLKEILIKKELKDIDLFNTTFKLTSNINSSKMKRNNSKPNVINSDYTRVDKNLLTKLTEFCERHKYKSPSQK